MKKYVKKYGNVSDLPFDFDVMTKKKIQAIRDQNPGQPRCMSYRIEFIKGHGASTKDPTWNRDDHIHTCCQSKVPWRHKAKCHKVMVLNDDLSDLKDIEL